MISIIVPVYNMEKYLDACVQSIINQEYKDIEILLVDDGSKDGSLALCKQWAQKDGRIRVFEKENGGQGSARNLALSNIRGEYVSFIDSDDLVTADMYTVLTDIMEKTDSDVAVCETRTFADGEEVEIDNTTKDKLVTMTSYEAMECRMNSGRYVTDSPCNKLYKANLFDSLRFVEGRLLEDSAMMYKVIDLCGNVTYTDKVGYLIRNNITSVSRVKYSAKRCDTMLTYEEMVDFISSKPIYAPLVRNCQALANGAVFYNAGEFYCSELKDTTTKKLIKSHARKQLKEYKQISAKNRLLLFMISNIFCLYGAFYKLGKK